MAGIANNLSTAIYGDPQDELTRERIATVQANRQRQGEQDALAAQETADQKGYTDAWAAAMMDADTEQDPAKRRTLQMKATTDHFRATGKIDPMMLPQVFNQQQQGRVTLQDGAAGHTADQITQRGKIDLSNALGIMDQEDIDYRSQGEFDAVLQGQRDQRLHGYDKNILGLEQGFEGTQNNLDRAGQNERSLINQGLTSDSLAAMMFGEDGYGNVEVLPQFAEANAAELFGKVARSGAGANQNKLNDPGKLQDLGDELSVRLNSMGVDLSKQPKEVQDALYQIMSESYAANPNAPDASAAVGDAIRQYDIQEANDGSWFGGDYNVLAPKAGAAPAGQIIRTGKYAGHTKGDDGVVYDESGAAVARWK